MLRRSWETKKNIIKELNNRLNEAKTEKIDSGNDFKLADEFAKKIESFWVKGSESYEQFFCRYQSGFWDWTSTKIKNSKKAVKNFKLWSTNMLNENLGSDNYYYDDIKNWLDTISERIDDAFNFETTLELEYNNEINYYTVDPDIDGMSIDPCHNKKNSYFNFEISGGVSKKEDENIEDIKPNTQPNNLKIKSFGGDSVELTWENNYKLLQPQTPTSIKIHINNYGYDYKNNPRAWEKTEPIDITLKDGDYIDNYIVKDLDEDKINKYGFKLQYVNDGGEGPFSNTVWVKDGGGKSTENDKEKEEEKENNKKSSTTFTETNIKNLQDITDESDTHIKTGLKGNLIGKIQKIISDDGIKSVGGIDNKFGTNTRRGVIDFQKKYKLGVDGIVGPETAKALIEKEKLDKVVKDNTKNTEQKRKDIEKIDLPVLGQDARKKALENIQSESTITKPVLDMMKRMNIIK